MSFNLAEALEAESVPVNEATRGTKFGKSNSLSSVRTASEGYLEQETLCRKISLSQKERFIQLITEENFNMKEAAKQVGISYSTAKKIYARFRHQLRERLLCMPSLPLQTPRSAVYCLPQPMAFQFRGVEIISTIAGREQPIQREGL